MVFGKHIRLVNAVTPYGQVRDYYIPIDKKGQMLSNYTGPREDANSLSRFPVREILHTNREEPLKELLSETPVLVADITTEKKSILPVFITPSIPTAES